MQTLRKKTSPCKYKNEPSRFLGDGVSFKAKLIGILEVNEARGDRMCQEALADLKMAIRAAGEHKQRITINIAIDGLRLRDEKTGDSLYHHPVHKISFIAQDMSDSRAFGYIFGSPDTGHRFFGIKTDKAASQVVIAMRDLFQVVFELKKKEIELAKQHIEQKSRFGTTTSSCLFEESTLSSKSGHGESKSNQESSSSHLSTSKEAHLKSYQNGESHSSSKVTSSEASKSQASDGAHGGNSEAIADLVDLELELSSIQQGIHQMERITPSDPFGPNKDDPFNNDPFGDSFISFPQKPFLPPPPPTGRERQNRIASDSSSLFSPKTPKTGDSVTTNEANLFKISQEDTASCDWFTPTGSDSLFDDTPSTQEETPAKAPEPTTQESNTSILSQIDVFTELDPLGTGRSKPYVDKKLFFQELKNPPKKVLKDLVQPSTDSTLFPTTFNSSAQGSSSNNQLLFPSDPFAESDPFDKTDPFSDTDFTKTGDPFDTDFIEDFKVFNKQEQTVENKIDLNDTLKNIKLLPPQEKLQPLFPSSLSKSPNKTHGFDKEASLPTNHVSPRTSTSKQNTYDLKFDDSKFGKTHENPSLDMSSESECAPEPPPRPASNISPIKPPPLPPKKQAGDTMKPPPRPPHTEESHYDYMESYETGPNSFESAEVGPPLPAPSRKSRFDYSESGSIPQRPKKNIPGASDEDYLTPIAPPLLPPQKKDSLRHYKHTDGILLPPPKRDKRPDKNSQNVATLFDSKPKVSTSPSEDKFNLSIDTLDITLSQLTLSGLNELATKLKIPPSQLSNMTLVQLTNYLSNYVRGNTKAVPNEGDATVPTFKADFSANFNDLNAESAAKRETYDRYAVFRELLQQEETKKEIKEGKEIEKTTIEVEEEKVEEVSPEISPTVVETNTPEITELKPVFQDTSSSTDRYAALREIVIEDEVEQKESNLEVIEEEQNRIEEDEPKEQNDLNIESIKNESEPKEKTNDIENNIIEYESSQKQDETEKLNIESPTKSSLKSDSNVLQSPVLAEETEIIQTNNHITSGSLSDPITGSSPEMDNIVSSETVEKKNVENAAGESWAIFDTPNKRKGSKEKQVQSEEGVSPWSSDSKEFGNGSPLDWQQRRDSESEGDWGRKIRDRDSNWWDTQAEMPASFEKQKYRSTYIRDRRSTDSYEEDWYEAEEEQRPSRRRRQAGHAGWAHGAGGQSSSSRDVSPWEEEEPRGPRREETWNRRGRGPSWDRLPRRDSWDEDDDYEYEEEYPGKYKYHVRHGSRDSDRASRDSDRHSTLRVEMQDEWERMGEQWPEQDRRHSRRKPPHDDRWCRGDWNREDKPVFVGKEKRYGSRYPTNTEGKWRGDRERKRELEWYYKREYSQESPWEDEYSNDPDEPPQSPRYLSARRNWKRPSSASEMDRKTGEIKPRQPYYVGTGGSDGERDRRYKSNRRSRSRDSQFTEMSHNRHKPDPGLTLRYPHRNRDKMYSQKLENNFTQEVLAKAKIDSKLDSTNNKKSTITSRKKGKDLPSPKTETELVTNKTNRKQHLMFENDFVNSETESPVAIKTKFNFENDFETSEAESPTITRHGKYTRTHTMLESDYSVKRNIRPSFNKQSVGFQSEDPRYRQSRNDFQDKDIITKTSPSSKSHTNIKQKSMFEDDFSPTDRSDIQCIDENGITVIPEELSATEQRVSFSENNLDRVPTNELRKQKHILSKTRLANNIRGDNLKKSESVNIFARENDPFDDDFFSGMEGSEIQTVDSKTAGNAAMDYKWTEDFDSFDIPEEPNK